MKTYKGTKYTYFTQPIVNIEDRHTIVHELLLRKFDPKENKWKLPSSFKIPVELQIELADEVSQIIKTKNISINLTKEQLKDEAVCQKIVDFYNESQLQNITIEMVKAPTPEILSKVGRQYHHAGILLGIDDVGSDNLKQAVFPLLGEVDTIKFAAQNMRGLKKSDLLEGVSYWFNKANSRDLLFTFEGVEDEEDIKMANALGITRCQGYYFSKPVLPQDLPNDLL